MISPRYSFLILVLLAAIAAVPALVLGVSRIYANVSFGSQLMIYEVPKELASSTAIVATSSRVIVATTTNRAKFASTTPSVPLIDSPAAALDHQDNKLKILLLGTDEKGDGADLHTDTIVLIIIDRETKRVSLLSFPRDLYVKLPDGSMGRINNAYQLAGFEGLNATLLYNFGISADHYALTNFAGFKKLVEDLGGIDVKVGQDFADWHAGVWTEIKEGTNHFDAVDALWYARSRETSNDLDRNRRTQEVVNGLWRTILKSENLTKIPQIYSDLRGIIKTDMNLSDIADALKLAGEIGTEVRPKKYTFSTDEVAGWTVPTTGAMVLLPKREEISMLLSRALGE